MQGKRGWAAVYRLVSERELEIFEDERTCICAPDEGKGAGSDLFSSFSDANTYINR